MTSVRRTHLLELREALAAAYSAMGQAAPGWTDAATVAGATPIKAVHLMELRAAVIALEGEAVRESRSSAPSGYRPEVDIARVGLNRSAVYGGATRRH